MGIIDGRNIWRCDPDRALAALKPLLTRRDTLWLAPSCSLLHVPVSLIGEAGERSGIDAELGNWLAFATEKLDELELLRRALADGEDSVCDDLTLARRHWAARRASTRVNNPAVAARLRSLGPDADRRATPFPQRQARQRSRFRFPPLPTTTIGSFPQTREIRTVRAAFKRGEIGGAAYQAAMEAEITLAVRKQEALGLDVLVHGEAERNDMVEYFGELLAGYAFSANGWVQSYGSRCVKPPIIFGDVSRPQPMTVAWTCFAQSLTPRPMKGMLTGPVTLLQWSFVRDDQRRAGWRDYLAWASRVFRVAASAVADDTQIHTHMCYSEFNDILPEIAAMDADVITIETSRSGMELLGAFGEFRYPNEIGPGVYDIHSPRVPDIDEMVQLLDKARRVISVDNLWVNPDCGLKTRSWPETEAALCNMVAAAHEIRRQVAAAS